MHRVASPFSRHEMASRRLWGLTAKGFGKLGEQCDKSSQDPVTPWLGSLSQSGQEE